VSLKSARTTTTTPVAVIGTIALSLSAAPAHAEGTPASAPAPALRAVPAAAPVAAAPTSRAAARTHTVVRGDTISGIAARNGLRTADVLAWNGLTWKSIIHPGDVIRLTAKKSSSPAPAKPSSAGSATSSKNSSATHTVRRGDTLWAIAQAHGVGLSKLLRANDLGPSAIIYPGEKLRIPGARETAAAPARSSSSKPSGSAKKSSKAAAPTVTLDREQIASVKTIIAVGRKRGVPDKGIAIALATAMVESWLRNLDYGTHDSLGLFQQRPSTGWGTPSQVRDPRRSAAAFFGGQSDPNGSATRGLLDIPDWRDMDFGAAAQAVQISAYPHRYGLWEKQAYAWLETYG
jgi:LysM repeat protein